MGVKLDMQILDKGSKYQRYRLTLPKSVIESHGWQNSSFDLEIKEGKIVLTPIKR